MIKINLLAEKKQAKSRAPRTGRDRGGAAVGAAAASPLANVIFVSLILAGVLVSAGWWWTLDQSESEWIGKNEESDRELERLKEVRVRGEAFEKQKELLTRKIDLITDLKEKQAVPVHILDQLSKSLPDFLWLENLSANNNQINITGKATTFTAVSNFYSNLSSSGNFDAVTMGRVFEIPEGVSFTLTCGFTGAGAAKAAESQS